jgi:hypothetical protein
VTNNGAAMEIEAGCGAWFAFDDRLILLDLQMGGLENEFCFFIVMTSPPR